MKTTRWFIQHGDARGQWIDSAHNPHEGWESRESASLGVASILKRTENISIKTISREVEVSAKDVVKVINQAVSLEIAGSAWLRREEEDWLRKTDGDNITWIPLFADYYYAYRAVEQQWWYVDQEKKFKVDAAPDIEAIYQEMKKI